MGVLSYDSTSVDFDDRTLAHLQIVIISKFRRNECVMLSWLDSQSTGSGRTSLWLTPTQPIRFHFLGSRAPAIDRERLTRLHTSADSGAGLLVTDVDGHLLHANAQLSEGVDARERAWCRNPRGASRISGPEVSAW